MAGTAFAVFCMMTLVVLLFLISLVCKLIHACVNALITSLLNVIGVVILCGLACLAVYLLVLFVNFIVAGDWLNSLLMLLVKIIVAVFGVGLVVGLFLTYGGEIILGILQIAAYIAVSVVYYGGQILLKATAWLYERCDAGYLMLLDRVSGRMALKGKETG